MTFNKGIFGHWPALCIVWGIFVFVQFSTIPSLAQGCSDAGFCTMGAMKPDQSYNLNIPIRLKSIEMSYYHGKSLLSPIIHATILDFNVLVNEKYNFQFKIPYQWVNGNFGNTNGVGDISISATKSILHTYNYDINVTLGAKIPTGDATKDRVNPDNGEIIMFPMYYQISLGTFDAIVGASLLSNNWLIAVGYQQPLIHNNRNRFAHNPVKWSFYPDFGYVKRYDIDKDLKRGADVMFRVERNWRFSNFNFNLGLLPIYRVSKDQIKNASDGYEKLDKTTGLALSALMGAGYQFNVKSSIKFIYGHKLIHRDVNPDGLTRRYVFTVGYQYKF